MPCHVTHVLKNFTCVTELTKPKKNILSKFRISGEPADVEQLMENVQFVPAAGLGYAQR